MKLFYSTVVIEANIIPLQLCSAENLLAFFLVSLSAMWVGQKAAYERAECDRGELAVYCRRGQLLDCRMKPTLSTQPSSRQNRNRFDEAWTKWIIIEQKKRLGLCIYVSLMSRLKPIIIATV
jgi:hypothetical protein